MKIDLRKHIVALTLLGIIFLGAILRLYTSERHFRWGVDQYYDLLLWERMREESPFGRVAPSHPFAGQEGRFLLDHEKDSLVIYNGIFYSYFMLPIATFSQFDPYFIVLFSIFIHLISIVLMYHVGSLLFHEKAGIIGAYLFAVSYWMVDFSRSYWTPMPLPFFILLTLFAIAHILKGRSVFWPLMTFAAGATSQLHNSGYVFLFFFFLLIPLLLFRSFPGFFILILSAIFFSIPLVPTVLTELSSNFSLINGLQRSFMYQIGRLYPIQNIPYFFFLLMNDIRREFITFISFALGFLTKVTLFSSWRTVLLAFTFGSFILAIPAVHKHLREKRTTPAGLKVLLAWICFTIPLPWIVRIYYDLPVQGFGIGNMVGLIHYLPFLFLFLGWWFSHYSSSVLSKFALVTFISFYSLVNLSAISEHIWKNTDSKFNYGEEYSLVKLISVDSQGKPFDLVFLNKKQPGSEILYFFNRYAFPLPQRLNGFHTPRGNNPSITILPNGPAEILYTIVSTQERGEYSGKDIGQPIDRVEPFILYKKILH